MEFVKILSEKNNIDYLYQCVCFLEEQKDYQTLEKVFKEYLVGSCDIRVWRSYLDYVNCIKKTTNCEVFDFIIKNIGHHWHSTDIYKEYIGFLLRGEDTSDKLDNIRSVYMRVLHLPLENLTDMYNLYEEFENEYNKLNARRLLNEVTQIYQNSNKVFNSTIGFINKLSIENCANLIDFERKNPLNLDEKNFIERLDFIYRYFISMCYKNEEPVYFYVDHLIGLSNIKKAKEVLEQSFTNTTSVFLKIYYGKLLGALKIDVNGEENPGKIYLLGLLEEQYDDVIAANLLNFILKKEGLESFRRMFVKFKLNFPIGPLIYKYVAETEFYSGGNKQTACNIYSIGLELFPESSLPEWVLNFLLQTGDEDNAKALFKKSTKTAKMWEIMLKYEYLYGGSVQYSELLNERINQNQPLENKLVGVSPTGILLKYKLEVENCSFGLSMDHPQFVYDFLFSLPPIDYVDDFLCNVDLEKFVDLIKEIKLNGKKKEKEKGSVDDDILLEAQKIEEENYDTAKDVRLQLDSAAMEQKGATEEVKRQGETLDAAKRAAVGVHREARKGEKLADDIEREGHIFSCRFACFEKLCNWFKRDSGEDKVEEIANKESAVVDDRIVIEEEQFDENKEELVPGQNKTDKELNAILNTVKGIRAEAEVQGREAERQKTTVKDIAVVNEEAEKVIKRTDKHLKEIE